MGQFGEEKPKKGLGCKREKIILITNKRVRKHKRFNSEREEAEGKNWAKKRSGVNLGIKQVEDTLREQGQHFLILLQKKREIITLQGNLPYQLFLLPPFIPYFNVHNLEISEL